jgi:hypothetical protein
MQERHDPVTTTGHGRMEEGDRFVCPTCGCEIVLERHGDPERMPRMQAFTCCCGTLMDDAH